MDIDELKSSPESVERRKQVLYWRLFSTLFEQSDRAPAIEQMAFDVTTKELGLTEMLLDPRIGIDTIVQHYPEMEKSFQGLSPDEETAESFNDAHDPESLKRALVLSKLLLNVFGPNASKGVMTAKDYNQWLKDVGTLEQAFGCAPGQLRSGRGMGSGTPMPGGSGGEQGEGQSQPMPGNMMPNPGGGGSGGYEISEGEIAKGLKAMEKDIIQRMALREVLKDSKLAEKLTPSMALVEQLLRDKSNLSGVALQNAKMLIRRYVDDLAQVLKLQVEQTKTGTIDFSVPPKKTFQNLDLKRTIWKNLTNWDPKAKRLYVDHLYYRHTAKKNMSNRLIIVIDQSGSMLDSMVNCAILGSIFAGLPKVEAHLIAYDTRSIDLTDHINDPFEVLLRTNLGGGNDWKCAMWPAKEKIQNPRQTAVVWISDFYEIELENMMREFKALQDSGVHLIPVGSVASSGYFSVNQWVKKKFKEMGTPVISGSVKTLIKEIKQFVAI